MQSVKTWSKRKKTVVSILVAVGALMMACIVCGVIGSLLPDKDATPTAGVAQQVATEQPFIAQVKPADTKASTNTLAPTNTPKPTITPRPTNTPTPVPTPVVYEGKGDKILDVQKPVVGQPAVAHITYQGYSNFSIINYDSNNQYMDLLVNEIGNYEGWVPIDFMDEEETVRFEIGAAGGSWKIELLPLSKDYVHHMLPPGSYAGQGFDVIIMENGDADIGKFVFHGNGNFAVTSYGSRGVDLLVNEIDDYEGEVMMAGTYVLEVSSDGPWTMDVTTR